MKSHFCMALASPVRHRLADDIADDLRRMKRLGYTGICLENDYVGLGPNGGPHFANNWRLYNIFDFTLGRHRRSYCRYLERICSPCEKNDLEVYMSFWLPRLNEEFLAYLRSKHPSAIGSSRGHTDEDVPTLCTCEQGDGLDILASMVEGFMHRFPQI